MGLIKKIQQMKYEMARWRQILHAEPELAFEEHKTARFISRQLRLAGIDVHSVTKTGIVGVLHGRNGPPKPGEATKAIMLRADMDALPIREENKIPYVSRAPGVMHACGHDGHMAMLLGAAKYLAETKDFDGTVYFVFQPAEEDMGGAEAMLQAGLFSKFPADAIYGLHNFPGLPLGAMATNKGQLLAANDDFFVTFTGTGGHAARPENTTDVLAAVAEAALAVKAAALALLPPGEPAMLSVANLGTAGTANNVLPGTAHFSGSIRTFDPALHQKLKTALEDAVKAVALKYDVTAKVEFDNGYPILANEPGATDHALDAARDVVGDANVIDNAPRTLGVEDFAFYLQQKSGNFMALGTGDPDGKPGPDLHSAKYDFNDAALPYGASYWVRLVETTLPLSPPPAAAPKNPPPRPGP